MNWGRVELALDDLVCMKGHLRSSTAKISRQSRLGLSAAREGRLSVASEKPRNVMETADCQDRSFAMTRTRVQRRPRWRMDMYRVRTVRRTGCAGSVVQRTAWLSELADTSQSTCRASHEGPVSLWLLAGHPR